MINSSQSAFDLSNVNALRSKLQKGDDDTLSAAAQQFEAIFVQMMLKSMRQAQDVLADDDSPFNSEHVKFYRDMYDTQLADSLSKSGGIGLATLIEQQLGGMQGSFTPASVLRSDASLPSLSGKMRQQTQQLVETSAHAYKAPLFVDHQAFVAGVTPHAQTAANQLGVDPDLLVAQAALETGWGQYVMHQADGRSANNLFGIKADNAWQGEKVQVDTLEYEGSVARKQKASFRAYDSLADSLNDYAAFISQHPRYAAALAAADSPADYAQALQAAGYATDPEYANKIMAVYRRIKQSRAETPEHLTLARGE